VNLENIKQIVLDSNLFLESLKKTKEPSFNPSLGGVSKYGYKLSLGFTCYGLKILKMTGEWENISASQKNNYINHLLSFQKKKSDFPKNYFVDDALISNYEKFFTVENFKFKLKDLVSLLTNKNFTQKKTILSESINAENKQVISTLYEVGYRENLNLKNLYSKKGEITDYLSNLNWDNPWSSGAQLSSLCVYSKTQNFNYKNEILDFALSILDEDTGSFHTSGIKNSREIINGAMKVITGLDWLDEEIPLPKKLIDFCLNNEPILEGCDVVDFIYVLTKCLKQSEYRRNEIHDVLLKLLGEINILYHEKEKGFSYYKNKSQTHYYGVKITNGSNYADIHGTLLCVWALNMILDSFGMLDNNLSLIKP